MTSREMQNIVLSVLIAAIEADGPIPRSVIYMAVDMNMETATIIQNVMVNAGWIKCTADTIRITDAGRELLQPAQPAAS